MVSEHAFGNAIADIRKLREQVATLTRERDEARTALLLARTALQECEYAYYDNNDDARCPSCSAKLGTPHTADCPIGRALAAMEQCLATNPTNPTNQ